jgi:lysozyme
MISENLIKKHEGFSNFCYKCPAGRLTIGYGRNIDQDGGKGISRKEAEMLLRNDIGEIQGNLRKTFGFFCFLSYERQSVLISMVYNIGWNGFLKFKKMIKALEADRYDDASIEMLDSRWAKQVPNRARELSEIMLKSCFKVDKR